MITPPVCYAAFTAAAIVGAGFLKTGFQAMHFSIAAYLLPFIFIFNHGFLLHGSVIQVISDVIIAISVVFLTANGLADYFLGRRLNNLERACSILFPIIYVLLQPFQNQYISWFGYALIGGMIIYLWLKARATKESINIAERY